VKRQLNLLVICCLLLTSLILISCGKTATNSTTSSTTTKTSLSTSSTTNNSSDTVTNGVTATITVEKNPSVLTYNPSQGEIFVINYRRGVPQSVILDTTHIVILNKVPFGNSNSTQGFLRLLLDFRLKTEKIRLQINLLS
jgi:ABC-type oligopeptide transport system substrate-binding subunit